MALSIAARNRVRLARAVEDYWGHGNMPGWEVRISGADASTLWLGVPIVASADQAILWAQGPTNGSPENPIARMMSAGFPQVLISDGTNTWPVAGAATPSTPAVAARESLLTVDKDLQRLQAVLAASHLEAVHLTGIRTGMPFNEKQLVIETTDAVQVSTAGEWLKKLQRTYPSLCRDSLNSSGITSVRIVSSLRTVDVGPVLPAGCPPD